ncbi:MAG: septum site-determining protein MinC [Clostridiales bacterium]|nr:septum site-determining protein MinC [Clostridiales bacterium]
MAGNGVDFKANANGLVVVFDRDEPFDDIYGQIARKLESGGFFFQTRYLAVSYRGRKLTQEEEGKISRMMAEKTGAKTVIFEVDSDFERETKHPAAATARARTEDGGGPFGAASGDGEQGAGGHSRDREHGKPREPQTPDIAAAVRRRYASVDLDECLTKFVRGTLRSGKLISYDGNVVVIGDINPGAEVEATGNIIVLGTVRGIVHAGAGGNKETSVIALHFAPTQLRIADIITRRTDQRVGGGNLIPEIAHLKGDTIVFEPLSAQTGK